MIQQEKFRKQNGRFLRAIILIIVSSLTLLALTLTAFGQDRQPTNPPINQPTLITNNSYGNPLPDEIGYQGQLVDDNGMPQVGSYTMEFAVFTDPPTYTLRYTENQTVSTDQDGLFNVMIGAVQPGLDTALADGNAWLEVKLDNEILAPRQPVGSVAYALYAQHLIGGTGDYSAIGGGKSNVANGDYAIIAGGFENSALGDFSSTGGGRFNSASHTYATVSGGWGNWANGNVSSIAGGGSNFAYTEGSVIGGGVGNVVDGDYGAVLGGNGNTATDDYAVVGGGWDNIASGFGATVAGGRFNEANEAGTSIGGGYQNTATDWGATIAGGRSNIASGSDSTIPGGRSNVAQGHLSLAAGYRAHANHQGAFVWADWTEVDFASTGNNQFIIRANGGMGVNTNDPQSQFHVADTQNGNANNLSAHIATIENESTNSSPDVLALVSGATNPDDTANYITFFDSSGAIAAIEGNGSGGVTYSTSGADFAEYLPLHHADEALQPGDVVGLVAGGVGLQTAVSNQVLVVSSAAGFVGNASEAEGRNDMVLVAFMGQVPVRVRGTVQAGDLLVASGLGDGTAVAISAHQLSPAQANQIVGQALESSDVDGVALVNTLVGLPTDGFWAARLSETQAQLDNLAARLTVLEAQVEADHE